MGSDEPMSELRGRLGAGETGFLKRPGKRPDEMDDDEA